MNYYIDIMDKEVTPTLLSQTQHNDSIVDSFLDKNKSNKFETVYDNSINPICKNTTNQTSENYANQNCQNNIVEESCKKPNRRVQFKHGDNLVLIKEIPPRGFYGSDVSDSESGNDEVEDAEVDFKDGDENKRDNEDTDDDSGSSSEDESDDDSDDSGEGNDDSADVYKIPNQPLKGSYRVAKPAYKQYSLTNKTIPQNHIPNTKPTVITGRTIRSSGKKPRPPISQKDNKVIRKDNRISNRLADTKLRKHTTKALMNNVMKSTSSSRSKDLRANRPHTANSSGYPQLYPKLQVLKKPKSATRITIDSPVSFLTNSPSLNRNLNYVHSTNLSNIYKMGDFIFPVDQGLDADHFPNIIVNQKSDGKPLTRHKQYNAWQQANGQLDPKLFKTPCIAPMWE